MTSIIQRNDMSTVMSTWTGDDVGKVHGGLGGSADCGVVHFISWRRDSGKWDTATAKCESGTLAMAIGKLGDEIAERNGSNTNYDLRNGSMGGSG